MTICISTYTSHLNQFLYSLMEYKKKYAVDLKIVYDKSIKSNCFLILTSKKTYFLDYSDSPSFSDVPSDFNYYFKRSLKKADFEGNVKPLNFQINIATSPLTLLRYLPKKIDFFLKSKVEVIRMIDLFKFTNMTHYAMLHENFLAGQKVDGKGKVIFCTRLWDPENHENYEEKVRRQLQNEFRIEACKIIKHNFKDATVGIFDSKLAREICPAYIFPSKVISKEDYFKKLINASICIADDGLKDTPGWKIGEYALMGKSIISTPICTVVENFYDTVNYVKLSTRSAYDEIPEKIEFLLSNDNYKKMSESNKKWSKAYINPVNYIARILEQ